MYFADLQPGKSNLFAPTNVKLIRNGEQGIRMTWEPPVGHDWLPQKVTGYLVKISAQQLEEDLVAVTKSNPCEFYLPTNLTVAGQFEYEVRLSAISGAKEGPKRAFSIKGQIRDGKLAGVKYRDLTSVFVEYENINVGPYRDKDTSHIEEIGKDFVHSLSYAHIKGKIDLEYQRTFKLLNHGYKLVWNHFFILMPCCCDLC